MEEHKKTLDEQPSQNMQSEDALQEHCLEEAHSHGRAHQHEDCCHHQHGEGHICCGHHHHKKGV